MKKTWLPEELVEHWTLLSHELALLTQKNDENRLGFAILFKFFQYTASFPENSREIPVVVVNYVANLLSISPEKYQDYNWQGRSIKYHRAQIRDFFGFREATVNDASSLANWLTEQALIYELKFEQLKLASLNHLRELKIEPPTLLRLERIINSALHTFESNFFRESSEQLSSQSKEQIDNLLNLSVASQELDDRSNENGTSSEPSKTSDICETSEPATWAELKTDPGRIGVESFQKEIAKLEIFRQLKLPADLFKKIPTKVLQSYKARVAVEHPRDLRRHPEAIRYTLFAPRSFRPRYVAKTLVTLFIWFGDKYRTKAFK